MKKAAIELSMNFLVVILLSLVIFGFGINFIYTIMNNSNEISELTLSEIDERIASLMCSDTQRVCIEKDTLRLEPDKIKIFTVKIINIQQGPQFKVVVIVFA